MKIMEYNTDELKSFLLKNGTSQEEIDQAEDFDGALGLEDLAEAKHFPCDYKGEGIYVVDTDYYTG